jgi:glycine/D-amino acid oxidase-like deaminating enzyme/nitrite reductase/ring-hydroxylating ferredoxin subunit
LDDRYYELERLHGEAGARLVAESHAAAIDFIERTAREEQIDCAFARLDGYLFNPAGAADDNLHRELDAAHRAGLKDVELVERAPLVSFNTGPALVFPQQGQLHPIRYLVGVANACSRLGGKIFTDTHATRIEGGRNARVETARGWTVHCDAIVVATNTPVNDLVAIHTRQRPYRTYVVGMAVPVGTVPQVLYWDTEDPYHYVRLQPAASDDPARPSRDLLIVGGEDHETGQARDTEARFERLVRWTRERFPMVTDVRFHWSGQVLEPVDGLAFIGRNPLDADNVFIATGDSGHGMTHGTIAGLLLTDLIQGRPNRWESLYNPARSVPQAAKEYLSGNLNMAAQYTDWITGGDAREVEAIPAGCGAVVRRGLSKVAVYRDELGRVHECSAVCPHLRGIVRWNDTEKTWDCPAHGSRFDALGHV